MAECQRFAGFDGELPQTQFTFFALKAMPRKSASPTDTPPVERIRSTPFNSPSRCTRGRSQDHLEECQHRSPHNPNAATSCKAKHDCCYRSVLAQVTCPGSINSSPVDRYRNTYLANHVQPGATEGCSQALFNRPQPRAGCQQYQFTDRGFLALWTNVLSNGHRFGESYSLIRPELRRFPASRHNRPRREQAPR
jgi:hypothetical protein